MLLLTPQRAVARNRLTAELWGAAPPRSAAANLRTHVSGLRSWLGDCLPETAESGLLSTGNGWALGFAQRMTVTIDVHGFERDLRTGRQLVDANDLCGAEPYLRRAALACRGVPLQDIPQGALLSARAAVLTAQWLSAVEEYADLLIKLGDYERARTVLHDFVGDHPARERAWRGLLLACYHQGDLAAVVSTYRSARRALAEELGVEPGAELTVLYRSMLRRDPRLSRSRPACPQRPGPRTVPLGSFLEV